MRPKQNGLRHANGSASQLGGTAGKGKEAQPLNGTERRGVDAPVPSVPGQKAATVTGTMVTQDGYRKAKDDLVGNPACCAAYLTGVQVYKVARICMLVYVGVLMLVFALLFGGVKQETRCMPKLMSFSQLKIVCG